MALWLTPGCGVPLTVGRGGRLPSYCADCIAATTPCRQPDPLSGGRRVTDMDTPV